MMIGADLPPQVQEQVTCSIPAAARYGVPAAILLAVSEREGGKAGQWVRNRNGSYDVGSLQFNTTYLADLRRWGITAADVAMPGCYPYELAAWRLRGHLVHDAGDVWQRAANYHSRTPAYNARYRAYIRASAARWEAWLAARASTSGQVSRETAPDKPGASTLSADAEARPSYVPRSIMVAERD